MLEFVYRINILFFEVWMGCEKTFCSHTFSGCSAGPFVLIISVCASISNFWCYVLAEICQNWVLEFAVYRNQIYCIILSSLARNICCHLRKVIFFPFSFSFPLVYVDRREHACLLVNIIFLMTVTFGEPYVLHI